MNKKGFIIIWDWRFFLFVGIIALLFFGYGFLSDGGVISDFFGEDLIIYKQNPKDVTLKSSKGNIEFTVYEDLNNYFVTQERSISYYEGEAPPDSKDFILKEMNNDLQMQALLPLVWKIREKAGNEKYEADMVIQMVQNIPYDYVALSTVYLVGRYPYEVLYENKGVCGEKSQLLSFLLKELGYGVVIFEFNSENHRAVGILCDNGNYNTNYCFIEATDLTNVGHIPQNYVGGANIRGATPEIIKISDGRKYKE